MFLYATFKMLWNIFKSCIAVILLKWEKAVNLCRGNIEHFFFLISDRILKVNSFAWYLKCGDLYILVIDYCHLL